MYKNAVLLAVILLGSSSAWGLGGFHVTQEQLRILPPYCKALAVLPGTKARSHEQQKKRLQEQWLDHIGGDFHHMHHYCKGMLMTTKADRMFSKPDKAVQMLRAALSEFQYMHDRASPGFPMMAELLWHKGRLYRRLQRHQEAVDSFSEAIKLKPKYTRAYTGLSDVYKIDKQFEDALAVVELGLKHNPRAKSLKRRQKELEAKLAKQAVKTSDAAESKP